MEFHDYASQPDRELDLLTGALLIAKDAYPGLDVDVQRERFAELAAPLHTRALSRAPLLVQTTTLGKHLYESCGFRGNQADYYDPRNTFLNEVMDRKLGIPISLAIVYIEVARRLGIDAKGVGFPGHFLVRVEDAIRGEAVMVDPYDAGAVLDREDLVKLLHKNEAVRLKLDAAMLAPAPTRHILARMLMNLRGIYANRADYPRLLLVLDRLIDLIPEGVDELRDRGLLWAKLGAPRAAIDDLKRYLSTLPHAGDVAEVRRLLQRLEQNSASLN